MKRLSRRPGRVPEQELPEQRLIGAVERSGGTLELPASELLAELDVAGDGSDARRGADERLLAAGLETNPMLEEAGDETVVEVRRAQQPGTTEASTDAPETERRLEELVDAEKEAGELLERRRAERREAERAEATRQLGEARAEAASERERADGAEKLVHQTRADAEAWVAQNKDAFAETQAQLEASLESERGRASELAASLDSATQDLADLGTAHEELEQRRAADQGRAESELEAERRDRAGLEGRLETAEADRAGLEQRLAETAALLDDARGEALAERERSTLLESDVGRLNQDLERVQNEMKPRIRRKIEQAQAEARDATAAFESEQGRRTEAEREIEATRAEVDRLEAAQAELEEQFRASERRTGEAERQILEARAEAEEWVERSKQGYAEKQAELESELASERGRAGELETILEGEREARAAAEALGAETERSLEEDREALTATRSELEADRGRIADLQRELEESRAFGTDLEQKRDELERDRATGVARIDELEALQEDLSGRLTAAEEQAEQARSEMAGEKEKRAEAEQRFEALVEMEADARTGREEHRRELETARHDLEKAASHADSELAEARAVLERERATREELERRLAAIGATLTPEPPADTSTPEEERGGMGENEDGDAAPLVTDGDTEDEPAEALPGRSAVPLERSPEPAEAGGLSRLRSMLGGRGVGGAGSCSICRREPPSSDRSELQRQGWVVDRASGVRLCANCRQDGWQLPNGADTPFRRFSDRGAGG